MGLLRLGSTLRVACEELTRYTQKSRRFFAAAFCFFFSIVPGSLVVACLLRLKEGNDAEFERLSWTPTSTPVSRLEVICLGVSKKVVPNAFCAFDFRLRVLSTDSPDIPVGQKLIWSSVFPIRPDSAVPAEGYLHLPQKQKFKAIQFMQGKRVLITDAGVDLLKNPARDVCRFSRRAQFRKEQSLKIGPSIFQAGSRFRLSIDCSRIRLVLSTWILNCRRLSCKIGKFNCRLKTAET